MATCKKCGEKVNFSDTKCSHCGIKSPAMRLWHRIFVAVPIVALFGIYLLVDEPNNSRDEDLSQLSNRADQPIKPVIDERIRQGSVAGSYAQMAVPYQVTQQRDVSFTGRQRNQVFLVIPSSNLSHDQLVGTAVAAIKALQKETHCVVCDAIVEVKKGSASDGDILATVNHVADGKGNGGTDFDGVYWAGKANGSSITF